LRKKPFSSPWQGSRGVYSTGKDGSVTSCLKAWRLQLALLLATIKVAALFFLLRVIHLVLYCLDRSRRGAKRVTPE
jgi:hypothetical protein